MGVECMIFGTSGFKMDFVCMHPGPDERPTPPGDGWRARDTPRFAFAFATGFGVRADSVIDIDSFV